MAAADSVSKVRIAYKLRSRNIPAVVDASQSTSHRSRRATRKRCLPLCDPEKNPEGVQREENEVEMVEVEKEQEEPNESADDVPPTSIGAPPCFSESGVKCGHWLAQEETRRQSFPSRYNFRKRIPLKSLNFGMNEVSPLDNVGKSLVDVFVPVSRSEVCAQCLPRVVEIRNLAYADNRRPRNAFSNVEYNIRRVTKSSPEDELLLAELGNVVPEVRITRMEENADAEELEDVEFEPVSARPRRASSNKGGNKGRGHSPKNVNTVYPGPASAPPLTMHMMQIRNFWFNKPNHDRIHGTNLPVSSLKTLEDREWLDDAIVNFYMKMIRERSMRYGYPNVHTIESSVYSLLSKAGQTAVENTLDGVNLFEHDMTFFPICVNCHWRLIVIDVNRRNVMLYNSLNTNVQNKPDVEISKNVLEFLSRYTAGRRDTTDDNCWKIVRPTEIPRQSNMDDCGVFVLQFAEYFSRGKSLNPDDFNKKHIPYFRRRMAYETITRTLLTSIH